MTTPLWGVLPYVAFALLITGLIWRYRHDKVVVAVAGGVGELGGHAEDDRGEQHRIRDLVVHRGRPEPGAFVRRR
ncbi:respiratory nitrate reductase subunit gamma [Streptomyces spinosirectus]